MDPFQGSQPFLNLLNSQYFPQDPNSHISLSQINFSQESHPTPPTQTRKEKRKLWSPSKDVVLCSAWLNISKDAIVSTEQRNTTFWSKINEAVGKFVGALDAATRNKKSGESEDNILANAYKIYLQDSKKPFILEHCWLVLRHEQKWRSSLAANAEGGSKRKANEEEATSAQPAEAAEPRPKGVKAAKNKNKKARSESFNSDVSANAVEAYEKMLSLKERDIALKKDFAKTSMLDNLLAKTEPLSDIENRLKAKLIEEIFML